MPGIKTSSSSLSLMLFKRYVCPAMLILSGFTKCGGVGVQMISNLFPKNVFVEN